LATLQVIETGTKNASPAIYLNLGRYLQGHMRHSLDQGLANHKIMGQR
jgi:hypothetical protein